MVASTSGGYTELSPLTQQPESVAPTDDSVGAGNATHGTFNCISLFAGGGGLTLGLQRAGFRILLATDVEDSSRATFEANCPETPFLLADIRRLQRSDLERRLAGHHIHLVAGGPPCQGFTTLGDQSAADPRNALFWAFRRVVDWTRPDVFLLENVAYLRSQYGGRFEKEITHSFESLGYRVSVATLNAADFGVPQVRRRVMFVGTRLPAAFDTWPRPTNAEKPRKGLDAWRTVGEAIMDLASLPPENVPNHTPLNHGRVVTSRYRLIPEGGRLPPPSALPAEIRRKNFGNTYKRLHRNRPALTLVPGNNAFPVHPTVDRSLTPREAARLQTFPDDYVFCGNRSEQCRLVGNAVPVRLAEAVGKSLAGYLAANLDQAADLPPGHQLSPLASASGPLVWTGAGDKSSPSRTAVSFFTGAGGLALGFLNSGFTLLASYDIKHVVERNLKLNFPGLRHFRVDVNSLDLPRVLSDCGERKVDVVFGGPPCQGFSVFGRRRFVNTRGHRAENDERNELAVKFVRLAIAVGPRAIVMENVKGILSTARGNETYVEHIERLLRAAGYAPEWKILNCADYGVPQIRERFMMVAARTGVTFRWPDPKYFPDPKQWQRGYVTVADAISDLADPRTRSREFSHVPMEHQPLVVERFKLIPEGGRLPERTIPENLRKGYRTDSVRNYSGVYRRLAMGAPAMTLVPGHNAFPIHPRLDRALTVREAARIQTFPDWMRFEGTRQQQCLLVGNAVPPVLATSIAQAVARALDGVYDDPAYKRDIYDLKASPAQ